MNLFQKTLTAVAFCLGSGTASAATIPLIFSNAGGSFAATFSDTIASNSLFDDYFTFDLTSSASGSADAISSFTNGISNLQFTNFQLEKLGSNAFTPVQGTIFSSVPSLAYASFSGLNTGNYALHVSGSSNSSGGTFAGNITLNTVTSPQVIAAIPEPGEFELMLAGFGFIGLVKRIRAK